MVIAMIPGVEYSIQFSLARVASVIRAFSVSLAGAWSRFASLVAALFFGAPTLPEPRPRFDFTLSVDSHHHAPHIETRKPSHVEVDRLMFHGRLPLHA